MDVTYLTGSSTTGIRESNDFYATPEFATRLLLSKEIFDGVVWEPACGNGAISKVLEGIPNISLISTDLYDRGYGEPNVDFLNVTKDNINHIVTNPPYKLAQPFVEHALKCCNGKVAMLLKLNFLEGQKRKPFLESTPLKWVYVFSKRISFDKGDEINKGNGLLAYAWFVWEHGYTGHPQIAWI